MSISKIKKTSDPNNNFVISVGNASGNTYLLDREYPAGGYGVASGVNDTTLDFYLLNSADTLVGQSSSRGLFANAPFSKVVILGQQANDILSFTYTGLAFSSSVSGESVTAAAYISSTSVNSLPNINNSTVISGGNFATNVAVYFVGTDLVYRPAKSIIRSTSKSLIIVRPDDFPISYGPYSIKVENPGVTLPVGSNSHILANSISPGSFPVWSSPSQINYDTGIAYSYYLAAPDQELSAITFSIVSGSLPTGLSLNQTTGQISGTPTQNQKNTLTFRATDAGGNYVDKTIIMSYSPVWTVSLLPVSFTDSGSTYAFTITATDANSAPVSYSIISGSLPSGLSLNSSTGYISGATSTTSTSNITIRAASSGYGWKDKDFVLESRPAIKATILSTQSWTAPAGVTSVKVLTVAGGGGGFAYGGNSSVAGTGGGAGGAVIQTVSTTPGQSYPVVIGAGGGNSATGSNTSFNGVAIANGGGAAGGYYGAGGNGGCGGGGWTAGGIGSQGKNGGTGTNGQYAAGGGGGMGTVGQDAGGNNGGNGGDGILYLGSYYSGGGGAGGSGGTTGNGGVGGGGAGNGTSGTANTGGGGGGIRGSSSTPGNGGSGVVVIAY